MHNTIEVFSGHLGELRGIYTNEVAPRLHGKRALQAILTWRSGLCPCPHDCPGHGLLRATTYCPE
jgi:hypothetical protein